MMNGARGWTGKDLRIAHEGYLMPPSRKLSWWASLGTTSLTVPDYYRRGRDTTETFWAVFAVCACVRISTRSPRRKSAMLPPLGGIVMTS
jgi:hypothetical protein